ncbi:hypothetical protein [Streptomyces sp. PD-S100-1]|uniref:hypothetical protein n=1 Tax=Streptomyces sp. PD-S100-1 TaxID=3394351 RepID=UPI0039BD12AB
MSTPAQPDNAPADPSTQPATPPAPTAPAPTPPEPTAPATPQPEPSQPNQPEPKAKAPKFEGDFDPAKFEKLVENIRGDVAAEKAKREAAEKKSQEEQAAFMKRVAAAFGIETDEQKPPTLEELAKQLEESRGETKASRDETRQTRVELAVYKSAVKHGADPDALLDSRTFAQAVSKLDPTVSDFNAQVEKAITDAVAANSKLKAKPTAVEPAPTPAAGAPMDTAPGGKRQLGKADVDRMTPKQIAQALAEGRLDAYLGKAG